MKGATALLLCCLAVGSAGAAECPDKVRVSLPNFPIPPLLLGNNHIAEPPGHIVSWVRKAFGRTGCNSQLILMRRPPNRQLAEIETGGIDFLPGFSPTPDLPAAMVFPMREGAINKALRLATDQTSLYVRAGETAVQWDGESLTGPRQRIGTSTGGSKQRGIRNHFGWEVEFAPTPEASLRKLLAGRIDVIVESDSVLDPLVGRVPVRKLSPPLGATHRYAPVRREFLQQYPDFTARFWLALCRESRLTYPQLPACT